MRISDWSSDVCSSDLFGHVVVDLGRAEGVIRRDQQIPREVVRVGDRVRSLILNVRRENRGPQIFLSRAHPDFMKKLFAQEVPEIYDGIRSEEHTSELQSLMRISYAVFCLKKKKKQK